MEDDTGLGALATGLIIVVHKFAWNLPGDIEEAAGGRSVGTKQSRVGLGTEGRGEEQHGQGSHGDLHDAGQRAECERKQRPSRVGTRGLAAAASFRGLSPVFSI